MIQADLQFSWLLWCNVEGGFKVAMLVAVPCCFFMQEERETNVTSPGLRPFRLELGRVPMHAWSFL